MFILLLLVPLFLGCRTIKNDSEIFGLSTTKSLKGLFASGVVLHHLCTYFCPPITSIGFYRNLGFIMVSGFFFISGYGLTYSAMRKENYTKHFLWKRVLPIIIGFYLSAIAYCIMYRHYHILSWERFFSIVKGENYWFIYAIVILYIGFWLSFRFFKKENAPYMCSAWVVIYMAVMYIRGLKNPAMYGFWWFNSCPAFIFGIWFCIYRDGILKALKEKYHLKLILTVVVYSLAFYGVYAINDKSSNLILICELAASFLFCILLVQFCMKLSINNFVLRNLGNVSLELYLVQALWIYVVGNEYSSYWNAVGMTLNIIIRTVILSYVIHYISKGIMYCLNKIRKMN